MSKSKFQFGQAPLTEKLELLLRCCVSLSRRYLHPRLYSWLKIAFRSIAKSEIRYYYHQFARLNTSPANFYYQSGKILEIQKKWQAAVDSYQQAIDENYSKPAKAYYRLGNALWKLDQFELAIAAYEQSIKIDRDFYNAYRALAESALKLFQWDIVVKACQHVIQINPNSFWSYYYLGQALMTQKHWDSAIQSFQRAIEIDPTYYWNYHFLSKIYLQQDKFNENMKLWQQGLQHNPNAPNFYRGLGDALTLDNQISCAITAYQNESRILLRTTHPHYKVLSADSAHLAAPNFIVIGTVKGGTTSFYDYLSQHPQILPAIRKEIEFWNNKNGNLHRGLDWYRAHFPLIPSNQAWITGEATPGYFSNHNLASKLAQVFPHIKLILLLRNPIDRAISDYYMCVRLGIETQSLEVALQAELDYLSTHIEIDSGVPSRYLYMGLYAKHMRRWLNHFDRKQFLILRSEDFFTNPAVVMQKSFQFLQVNPYELANYPIMNKGYYEPISESLRQSLSSFFRSHNQDLENLLDQPFNWD